jgi:hypothetical protein
MPFLSSTQFILVLWLLVAAAPMATVLLNGSLVVFAPAAEVARTSLAGAAEEGSEVRTVASHQPGARPVVQSAPALVGASAALDSGELPAASVCHTALQRHRPRLA